MSEAETVRSILMQARQIRQRSRTSCVPLQNLLLYQQLTLESKAMSMLSCSLCSRPKAETSKQFRRAFKTMSRTQQAEFYLMMVKNVQKFLKLQQKNGSQQYLNKEVACQQQIMKMRFEAKDGLILKRFAQVDAEIARKDKTIRFIQLKEGIDLHAYLLRKSRGKLKNCIVLQSTQAYTPTETIRLCFNGIDFQDSFNVIYHLWQQAQYENIAKILFEDNRYPRRSTGKIGTIRSTIQMDQLDPITSRLTQDKLSLPNGKMLKSAITSTQGFPSSSKRLQKIESTLVSPQLLQSLNTFSGLNKKSFNIYTDKYQSKVRKVFEVGSKETTIDKILQSIDEIKQIRRRKQYIHEIKLLNSIPSERTNLYREVDEIENKLYQFVYLRHQFRKNGNVYFFEKSIELDDFKDKHKGAVLAKINYCIWRVRQIGDKIQVLAEADIEYGGKVKDVYRISSEYIGQFSRYLKKELEEQKNNNQQSNEQISIQSSEFENQYLSEISNQQQFFTVTGSLNSSQKGPPQNQNIQDQQLLLMPTTIPHHQNYPTPLSRPSPHHQKLIQQLTSKQTAEQTLPQNTDSYLRVQHQLSPQNKGIPNYMKQSEGHLLFGSQWIINQNGELVNINKEKIKVQSSVLKLVLQRMGKNLLSGKSIMNMSLPIQIFGTDSNLQRIARGYIYAPIFLQKAANTKNPVQRLTNIFCFGLGFSTSYIRMQKPFNPVLGQTYQGVIDGCPVYAEQISHHPPISSMLMIGRGYKVHGNFQAKVQMGFNSASGINEGFNIVQFQDGGVVRFNTPPGEIQGIIMGDRKLSLIKKSYYIDKKNRLVLQISWGKKKSNPRSNSNLNDFFSGKILRISNTQKLEDFKNIRSKDIEQELGQIHGRFTGKVYFEDQLVFDLDHDPPFHIQDYGLCLQSDSRLRSDIIQRKRNDFNAAQDAKEEIQEVQRRDRKLRKQRHINN